MTFSRIVSIFFGAGLMRPAPGTWGSVAAVAVGLILYRIGHFPLLAAATVVVTATAITKQSTIGTPFSSDRQNPYAPIP